MRSKAFRLTAVLLAAVLLFSPVGCGGAEQPDTTATTTATPTTVTTTAPPVRYINLLTGEQNLETPKNRLIAFMIGNSGYSGYLQQKNIDKADFYMESETEGGITRIMAVFGSIENLPDEIGPVRSARTHFVKMAKALDAIYGHVGGSTLGKQLIRTLGVRDLDSLTQVSAELKGTSNGRWVEHVKVFPKSKVTAAITQRKLATTTTTKSPYAFGDKKGDGVGNAVQVAMSGSYYSSFTYDAAKGLYVKHRGNLTTPVHTAYDGDPIAVKNVIVMYGNRFQEDAGHISFTLSSGTGVLLVNGTSREIKWSRTNSQLTFTETDGTPLTVAVGKTYVLLTSAGLKSRTVIN